MDGLLSLLILSKKANEEIEFIFALFDDSLFLSMIKALKIEIITVKKAIPVETKRTNIFFPYNENKTEITAKNQKIKKVPIRMPKNVGVNSLILKKFKSKQNIEIIEPKNDMVVPTIPIIKHLTKNI